MDSLAPTLGRLSLFPREVRDEIYHHVFSARYLAPRPGIIHHCMDNYAGRRIPTRSRYGEFVCANIGIFRASRVLRQESARIFFGHCVFKFSIARILEDENDLALLQLAYDAYPIPEKDDALRLLRQSWRRPKFGINVPYAMYMRNIELCVDMRDYIKSKNGPGKVHPVLAIMTHLSTLFGGSQPVRRFCRVIVDDLAVKSRRPHDRLFFDNALEFLTRFLKILVGFRSLIVVFTTVGPERYEWLRSIDRDLMREHARISEYLSLMKGKLETVLGPSTAADSYHGNTCSRSFSFHPHGQLKEH